jgi:uncharacterized protein
MKGEIGMPITNETVLQIFKGLETGDGSAFFEHVADDVELTVMGTHPLAGHYLSKKAFIEGTFAKLGQVLQDGAQLHVEHLIVKDSEVAVVPIVKVRAYLDSAMVAQLFEENPIHVKEGTTL